MVIFGKYPPFCICFWNKSAKTLQATSRVRRALTSGHVRTSYRGLYQTTNQFKSITAHIPKHAEPDIIGTHTQDEANYVEQDKGDSSRLEHVDSCRSPSRLSCWFFVRRGVMMLLLLLLLLPSCYYCCCFCCSRSLKLCRVEVKLQEKRTTQTILSHSWNAPPKNVF